MPTKRLFVPDDILRPAQPGENKNIRLLQYVNSTTQENFDAFLTHHALVYILSGVKQIKVGSNHPPRRTVSDTKGRVRDVGIHYRRTWVPQPDVVFQQTGCARTGRTTERMFAGTYIGKDADKKRSHKDHSPQPGNRETVFFVGGIQQE